MSKWTGWGLLLLFLWFPQAVKNGITNGLDLGVGVLIPGIFPYLVMSGILIKTGAVQGISKKIRLGKFSSVSKEMLVPALFCGYPTGARLASAAYHNSSITKEEYHLLFFFANIPGFGFTVSYLGGIFQNSIFGICIYLSFVAASLTLLWFYGRKLPNPNTQKQPEKTETITFSDALVESVTESAPTMVSLLFFVCFFSSLIYLVKNLQLSNSCFAIFASFLEITSGIVWLTQHFPSEVTVFFAGFSGLSVMFQSLYFDKKHTVNILRLMLGRMVYGSLSVCYFLLFRGIIGCV